MTSSTTIASEPQHFEGRSVRDVVETSPATVDEVWCRRILRQILQSLELQYAMQLPRRWITPDTIVFHQNGEPLLLPDDLAPPGADEAEDLTALARVIHFAITRELAPGGPLHGRVEGYSDSLTTAVDACMDPDPARRPHTIAALRERLGIVTLGPLPEAPLDLPDTFIDGDDGHAPPAVPDVDATAIAAPPAAVEAIPAPAPVPMANTHEAGTTAGPLPPSAPVPAPAPAPAALSTPASPLSPPATPAAPAFAAAAPSSPAAEPATTAALQSASASASAPPVPSTPEPAAAPASPPQAGTAGVPPVPHMASASDAAVAFPAAGTSLRRGAGLTRRQRWAIAAGGAAALIAGALVLFAELRDSGAYDHIVLTLPQTGDGTRAAQAPQDAAPAAPTAAAPAAAASIAAVADGSAAPGAPGAATSLPDIDLSTPAAGTPGAAAGPAATAGAPANAAGTPAQAGSAYKVQVAPWGVVYVDGVDQGVSPPVKRLVLAPGRHTIRVTNPNFQERVFDVDSTAGDSRIAVDFSEPAR